VAVIFGQLPAGRTVSGYVFDSKQPYGSVAVTTRLRTPDGEAGTDDIVPVMRAVVASIFSITSGAVVASVNV
jgi:hypothetical protein